MPVSRRRRIPIHIGPNAVHGTAAHARPHPSHRLHSPLASSPQHAAAARGAAEKKQEAGLRLWRAVRCRGRRRTGGTEAELSTWVLDDDETLMAQSKGAVEEEPVEEVEVPAYEGGQADNADAEEEAKCAAHSRHRGRVGRGHGAARYTCQRRRRCVMEGRRAQEPCLRRRAAYEAGVRKVQEGRRARTQEHRVFEGASSRRRAARGDTVQSHAASGHRLRLDSIAGEQLISNLRAYRGGQAEGLGDPCDASGRSSNGRDDSAGTAVNFIESIVVNVVKCAPQDAIMVQFSSRQSSRTLVVIEESSCELNLHLKFEVSRTSERKRKSRLRIKSGLTILGSDSPLSFSDHLGFSVFGASFNSTQS
ncbi:hypothetical protein C8R45DRAFT_924326 [Mycena sanguinolenta]|nr:hypothetical protein C8R45DRAFT_924326 [Mycena sanguinolenta]